MELQFIFDLLSGASLVVSIVSIILPIYLMINRAKHDIYNQVLSNFLHKFSRTKKGH